jgi:hypothetical protein
MVRWLGDGERRCPTTVDGERWLEVVSGWSYSTLELRGV